MSIVVEIGALTKENGLLVINTKVAESLNLINKKVSYIAFGAAKCYFEVRISDKLEDNTIQISNDIIEYLKTPKYLRYEIKHDGDGIFLGPAIGYLLSKNKKSITPKRLRSALAYVSHYNLLNGAVIIFSLDCVNKDNHTINGYCYNPKNNSWEEGVFPYPSAIYRRLTLDNNWKNHFLSVIGDNLFYNYYFNKWKMHQWFSKDKEMSKYFPKTILYKSSNDIQAMLSKYGCVYAKPISNYGGKGIIKISNEDRKIVYKYRKNGINQQSCFDTMYSAKAYGAKLFKGKSYILQQPIDLKRYQGEISDIRCTMLRDNKNIWECSGIMGRIAAKGSVVCNETSGGTPLMFDNLLINCLGYSKSHYAEIKKDVESISIKASEFLDSCGIKAAVLGIDMGIDTNGKLWIIEINVRDPGDLFSSLGDYRLLNKTKTSVMLYAKYLAGFGPEDCDNVL
jgi:glutathione synthase/RimK-type ligase-like ATP-grasp enzyme